MSALLRKIRDPIHNFISVDQDESKLINSNAFQRLRHIHQLALSYNVFPGATHKRFEHSLGVMELAGRAFDTITSKSNLDDWATKAFPILANDEKRMYWRKVLRLAALCHDLGHPPFSHAGEELFPKKFSHEDMTRKVIESKAFVQLFKKMVPPVIPEHVVKLALGPKKASDLGFENHETLLSEVIISDSLGVDRMDYLLRDAYHSGVPYGKFDHFHLLETLRILPAPNEPNKSDEHESFEGDKNESTSEASLGLLIEGIHSSEALLLARHFMYSQVYFHRVRIAYNHHLKDFLSSWLKNGTFPTQVDSHLKLSDNEVNAAIRKSFANVKDRSHLHSRRLLNREHFKTLYVFTQTQISNELDMIYKVYEEILSTVEPQNVILHIDLGKKLPQSFPVKLTDGKIQSSISCSSILSNFPKLTIAFILVEATMQELGSKILKKYKLKT